MESLLDKGLKNNHITVDYLHNLLVSGFFTSYFSTVFILKGAKTLAANQLDMAFYTCKFE